jgi:hypothetical protein
MANPKKDSVQSGGSSRNVPYLNAYGNIAKTLDGIIKATTPDRFTQDFLAAKLGLSGGSATPVIPFLKRTGFLNGDGTPTELYKQFRNETLRGSAAAQAARTGYKALYDIHEYAHDLNDKELMGVIVQATGLAAGSATAKAIKASFKALKNFANFEDKAAEVPATHEESGEGENNQTTRSFVDKSVGLKLGYTINLNLPATSDIAVFNAIFKSLREHLLD